MINDTRSNSSVKRQKGESHMCVSGGKKCLFFGKFGVLCFLETPVLRFALLPYYRLIFWQLFIFDFLQNGFVKPVPVNARNAGNIKLFPLW